MIFILYQYLKNRYKDCDIKKYYLFITLLISIVFIPNLKLYLASLLLTAISIVDYLEHKIPNELNWMFFFASILFCLLNINVCLEIEYSLLIALLFLIILALLSLLSNAVGFADVRILMSILLGYSTVFFLNFLFYLSIGLFLVSIVFIFKTRNLKKEMALAPLIHIAFILTLNI